MTRQLGFFLMILSIAAAGTMAAGPMPPDDFRTLLLDLAGVLRTPGTAVNADHFRDGVAAASAADLERFYSSLEEPERFCSRARNLIDRVGNWKARRDLALEEMASGSAPGPRAAQQQASPEYPGGPSYEFWVDPLLAEGVLPDTTARCDDDALAEILLIWEEARFLAIDAQGICDSSVPPENALTCPAALAGWDFTQWLEGYIERCRFQDGAVDGAEIEAALMNSVLGVMIGDALLDDLATHDADLKSQLSAHDAAISAQIAGLQAQLMQLDAFLIEKNLKSCNVLAGLYLPRPGGHAEDVRDTLEVLIAQAAIAGFDTRFAQVYFDLGAAELAKPTPNFKGAYQRFCTAYSQLLRAENLNGFEWP